MFTPENRLSFFICISIFCLTALTQANHIETVVKTEVFTIALQPSMFNWTYEGNRDQYVYEASLVDYPDLPSWIHYTYSERHHCGYLYGVVPSNINDKITLEVVAWNKKTFETRTERIDIIIEQKLNPALYEVHIKIDNLNVADLFDSSRMEALFDIFTNYLWGDAAEDLYVTFLESAVALGARRPVNPQQGDGVIVKLGTETPFSAELLELQQEVLPLYSLQNCPRNFRKTSVERLFRDRGFLVDWCKFHLIDIEEEQKLKQIDVSDGDFEPAKWDEISDDLECLMFSRDRIPERSYKKDLAVAIALPMLIMTFLVILLSFIICVVHDDIMSSSKDFIGTMDQDDSSIDTALVVRARNAVRSLSQEREYNASPDILLPKGVHCRPSPPPYVRPRHKPELRRDDANDLAENSGVEVIENDDGNAWYC